MATTARKSGKFLYVVIVLVCTNRVIASDLDTPEAGKDGNSDQSQQSSNLPASDQSHDTLSTNGQSKTSDTLVNSAAHKDQVTENINHKTGENLNVQNEALDNHQDTESSKHEDTLVKNGESESSDENTNKLNDESNNQSFFSIGSIIKSIVEPVFEDFEKDVRPNLKQNNETVTEDSVSSDKVNETTDSTSLMNQTLEALNIVNKTEKNVRFQCSGRNLTDSNGTVLNGTVKIVNNTGLLNLLNFDKNDSVSDCVLVLFFAPWCPFCAKMAPNYNALARAFPQLEVLAVDAAHFSNLNARFGTVLVPNILLFHQSRAVVRFNQTDKSLQNLITFVQNVTGLEPNTSVNVTSEDLLGPLSSVPTEEVDYLLWISWVFVIVFSTIVFVQSSYGQQWINKVCILWQEHQHID